MGVPSQVAATAFRRTSGAATPSIARPRRLDHVLGSTVAREGPSCAFTILLAPLKEQIEVLRRAWLGVKGEGVPANHHVLNPFAGELLQ
jgi:hypothetical protein